MRTRTITVTLLTAATALTLAACSGGSDASASASPTMDPSVVAGAADAGVGYGGQASATPTDSDDSLDDWAQAAASAASTDSGTGSPQSETPDGAADAAHGWEQAQANQDGTTWSDPDDWLKDAAQYTTIDLPQYKRAGANPGGSWNEAHAEGADFNAKVTVDECNRVGGWEDQVVLVCTMTTTVVDGSGKTLDADALPITWQSIPGQRTMQYTMVKDGGSWKVSDEGAPSAG